MAGRFRRVEIDEVRVPAVWNTRARLDADAICACTNSMHDALCLPYKKELSVRTWIGSQSAQCVAGGRSRAQWSTDRTTACREWAHSTHAAMHWRRTAGAAARAAAAGPIDGLSCLVSTVHFDFYFTHSISPCSLGFPTPLAPACQPPTREGARAASSEQRRRAHSKTTSGKRV